MAYNFDPNYDFSGRLDRDALNKSLEDVRARIAALGTSLNPENTSERIKKAIAALGNDTAPVYGQGIPEIESYYKNHTPRSLPPEIQKNLDRNRAYKEMFLESLTKTGGAEGNIGNKEAVPPVANGIESALEQEVQKAVAGLKLPQLEKKTKTNTETILGSILKKNPSFDGYSFEQFLQKAKETTTPYIGRGTGPEVPMHPGKHALYNKLLGAGLSEGDMLKAAQYAGLENVRTGKKGESDFKQMVRMFEDNYMIPKETTKEVVKGMGKADKLFGKKFGMSDYEAALAHESQDKNFIKNFLKDYAAGGGKVSKQVRTLFPKVNF